MLVHECRAAAISRPKTHRECSADNSSQDDMTDAGTAAGLWSRRHASAACCCWGGDFTQVPIFYEQFNNFMNLQNIGIMGIIHKILE